MPFEKGKSGNPEGKRLHADAKPDGKYVDEPDAPQLLRDMRWVYAVGKKTAKMTPGQTACMTLIEADAPRFLATLERLEGEWAEVKKARLEEERRKAADDALSGARPASADQPVQLDDVSERLVSQIDRWLAAHKRRAEALHPH